MTGESSHCFWDLVYSDALRHHRLFNADQTPPARIKLLLRSLSPRLLPAFLYRCSYYFGRKRLRVLSRACSLLNFLLFGIEIAIECRIGPGLFFPHTQGTVIGAYEIGENATIYQGVTLGAKDLNFEFSEAYRPTIGDNVIIGAGAKVLGGITLGTYVKIGANSVVLSSVPENSVAVGIPAKIINAEGR